MEPRLLSFLSLIFPFPRWFSFFAALLLSVPVAPRSPPASPHCPRQAWDPECPQNTFSTPRKGSQSTVRVGRPRLDQPLASWGVPEGWAPSSGRGEGLPGGGVGLGRWGPLPVEEGGPGGPEGSGAPRWVPGQRETARGAPCPGVGAGCSPVTPPGTGTRGHGPVHTAHGRSESKHLKPTPAGHAEGCPVIALCRPGSPWRAGRGPVSRESGPGGLATQHRAGAAQLQGRPLPSPGHAPLLGLPEEPGPPVSGAVWPGTWAARPPWPPALQLVGGSGGVEVGGASGPPGPGREVKLGAE